MSVFRDFKKKKIGEIFELLYRNLRDFIISKHLSFYIQNFEPSYTKFQLFLFIYIISKPSRFYNIETLELLYQNPRAFNAFTGFIVISFLEKLQGSALLRIEFAWSWGNSDYINMYYNIPPFKTKIIKALLFKNKR